MADVGPGAAAISAHGSGWCVRSTCPMSTHSRKSSNASQSVSGAHEKSVRLAVDRARLVVRLVEVRGGVRRMRPRHLRDVQRAL
jgi:hypothetical protein